MGCSPWGRKESDTTEATSMHTCISALTLITQCLLPSESADGPKF